MDITIYPQKLSGTIEAIPSKSQAHRLLICAAFSDKLTFLTCTQTNADIEATAQCLRALGATVDRTETGYIVSPVTTVPTSVVLDCGESGSTLRFLLPIVCALGVAATFVLGGRLPYRPLSPLWDELERMGCKLSRPTENTIQTVGKLHSGQFTISGSVSSQFISGLLFASALMDGDSSITITGKIESKPYIHMTQLALSSFGVNTDNFEVTGRFPLHSPENIQVEGDWSNAAFFLAAQILGNPVQVKNLNPNSPQGDRAISTLLNEIDSFQTISAEDIPDLVPILSVVYAANKGALIQDIARLRLKESDRIESTGNMLTNLGVEVSATENTFKVSSGKFHGCIIDSVNDHRIAMSAAIAATIADGPVTILGAECVSKSYPSFWHEYKRLGGHYEQHIR